MPLPWLSPAPVRSPFDDPDKSAPAEPWLRWLNALQELLANYVLKQKVVTVSAAYNASPGETVLCDTTVAGFTVTLPLAAKSVNCQIRVMKTSADGNTLTVSRAGADTINGANTQTTAAQYGKFTLVPNGVSKWLLF